MRDLKRDSERAKLIETLHEKYVVNQGWRQQFIFWRKRIVWLVLIEGTKALKRLFDIFIAGAALVVLSPIFLLIAFGIWLEDRGPIFYISDRVGRWGGEFRFPKFRTMVVGAEQLKKNLLSDNPQDITFKMKKDPRVTRIGKFLRKSSLDELPQLWSVLKGDMSLVGPRPPLPDEVANYTLAQRRRLDILPGITCIWQVSGRSETTFQQQVSLDLQYIENQSFWGDLKLLLRTIPAVFFGRGAY